MLEILELFSSIIEYPGAFVHWLLQMEQSSFEDIVKKHYFINLAISFFIYAIIGAIFW